MVWEDDECVETLVYGFVCRKRTCAWRCRDFEDAGEHCIKYFWVGAEDGIVHVECLFVACEGQI